MSLSVLRGDAGAEDIAGGVPIESFSDRGARF
jgi:hypothetical protein